MKKTKKKPPRQEIMRTRIGLQVMGGHNTHMTARQLYRVTYDDGTDDIVQGDLLFAAPFKDLKRDGDDLGDGMDCAPDLDAHMRMIYPFMEIIGDACWKLDAARRRKF